MQIHFIDENIKYDGSQLSSHFAYRNWGLLGDSCVAFLGPCEVSLDAMVDIEDVRRKAPIFSPSMVHFIFESFLFDLKAAALFQRIMVVRVYEELLQAGIQELRRVGDDLFVKEKKLSISIAAPSPVSTLIHLALNIETQGVPVAAVGLKELGIHPTEFAKTCLKNFQEEYLGVLKATCKVRGVP